MESLDDRLMRLTAGMPEQTASDARSCLAAIREAWRGADYYPDVTEALQVIEENAAALRQYLNDVAEG